MKLHAVCTSTPHSAVANMALKNQLFQKYHVKTGALLIETNEKSI